MKTKITILSPLCFVLCICGLQDTFAQKATDANGFPDAKLIRKTFGISCSVPEGFNFRNERVTMNVHENTGNLSYFSLESDDARCKLFWTSFPTYSPTGPVYGSENPLPLCPSCSPSNPFYGTDLSHRRYMWRELAKILETEDIDMDDHITVVAGREARERFNADSVFMFDVVRFVPMETMPQYEYCTRMYISRKGRPMLMFLWLFTPEGKQNEEQYIRQLDGRAWYDNRWGSRSPERQFMAEVKYMMNNQSQNWDTMTGRYDNEK